MLGSILRQATKNNEEPFNILTCPTHERWESNLCKTNSVFYAVRTQQVKDWNTNYAPVPTNYILLNPAKGDRQIPVEVEFDLVLVQNRFGQYQLLSEIAKRLHLPLVVIEHTAPPDNWPQEYLDQMKAMRGNLNIFISEWSRKKWGWRQDEAEVIHHGIDTELFHPDGNKNKKQHILTVVNDWINRDWCCGYDVWRQATRGLPVFPVGDTPGLSRPAPSVAALADYYAEASVFINTSLVSPIPTALLEAMASGCACISTATCMVPEIIQHGKNGFISNNTEELRSFCKELLNNPAKCLELGKAARQTILDRFSLSRFVSNWNMIFERAANTVFTGKYV